MKRLLTTILVLFALGLNAQNPAYKDYKIGDTIHASAIINYTNSSVFYYTGNRIFVAAKNGGWDEVEQLPYGLDSKYSYDTIIVEGLGLYVPNNSKIWDDGSIMALFPIKKLKIEKYEVLNNGIKWYVGVDRVEVFRLMPNTNAKCHPCPLQWVEINLREETEIFFVEKPK